MPFRVLAGGAWLLTFGVFIYRRRGKRHLPLISAKCLRMEDDLLQIGEFALDGGDILFVLLHGGA
jgi:hypothetical protein